jgi:hypothetical protein
MYCDMFLDNFTNEPCMIATEAEIPAARLLQPAFFSDLSDG